MQVIKDTSDIGAIAEPELRQLIQRRTDELLGQFEPGEYTLEELAQFIVVEPGDAINAIDDQLGWPILANRWTGIKFGEPGFTPSFELAVSLTGWYELVFVIDDSGYGIELFVPRGQGIPPELTAMCQAYATVGAGT